MIEEGNTYMTKKQTKQPQINKNNKTKPENLMKKEYIESYEKLKKEITDQKEKSICFKLKT